jgi:hypothetical protein
LQRARSCATAAADFVSAWQALLTTRNRALHGRNEARVHVLELRARPLTRNLVARFGRRIAR